MTNKLGIVIVSTKETELLTIGCIESIKKYDGVKHKIYLIYNSGIYPDSILQAYMNRDSAPSLANIHCQQNTEPLSVANSWNQGIDLALKDGCEYICVLNNDTIIGRAGCFEDMARAFDMDDKVGVVSCMSNFMNGNQIYNFEKAQHLNTVQHNPIHSKTVSEHVRDYYRDLNVVGMPNEIVTKYLNYAIVPSFSWFCFVLSKKTIDMVGIFDENLEGAMLEDTDYDIRLDRAGLQRWIARNVFIYHYGNASIINLALGRGVSVHQQYLDSAWKNLEYLEKKYPNNLKVGSGGQWLKNLKAKLDAEKIG